MMISIGSAILVGDPPCHDHRVDHSLNSHAVSLRPPGNRVSRRAIGYWTLRAGLGWLFVLVAEVGWLLVDGPRAQQVALVGASILVIMVHLVVMPQWRYRVHLWEATDLAVYTQSGWLNQERRIAPVSRIQTVDSQRGPLAQLFGLTSVTVTTASAAGPLTIDGLDRAVAQRLVDDLTANTQATPGDGT